MVRLTSTTACGRCSSSASASRPCSTNTPSCATSVSIRRPCSASSSASKRRSTSRSRPRDHHRALRHYAPSEPTSPRASRPAHRSPTVAATLAATVARVPYCTALSRASTWLTWRELGRTTSPASPRRRGKRGIGSPTASGIARQRRRFRAHVPRCPGGWGDGGAGEPAVHGRGARPAPRCRTRGKAVVTEPGSVSPLQAWAETAACRPWSTTSPPSGPPHRVGRPRCRRWRRRRGRPVRGLLRLDWYPEGTVRTNDNLVAEAEQVHGDCRSRRERRDPRRRPTVPRPRSRQRPARRRALRQPRS